MENMTDFRRTLETGVDPLLYYTFVSVEETTCIHLGF